MIFFIESIFYSYAQIFFSNRLWFGAAAFIATMVMPEMGIAGLCGVVISNSAALYLKFDKEKVRTGFYGFNGILFGIGASFYFELTPFLIFIILVFILITFFISAVLEHYMASAFNLPGLSLPFIVSLHIFLIFISNFDHLTYFQNSPVDLELLNNLPPILKLYFKSFSQIFFQSNIITGILLVASLLFFSRVMFVNSIIAFIINFFIVTAIFESPSEKLIMLTSLNSIFVSFALGGSLIILSRKTFFTLMFSSLFVIIFTAFFHKLLLNQLIPVSILPFNIVVLATVYSLKFRQEHSDLVLLYFKPGSPEENFYYHGNRQSRFKKFMNLFPELPFFGEWFVPQGIEGNITHKGHWKNAWDFNIKNSKGEEYSDTGLAAEDFYCYNTPVAAPMDGKVVNMVDYIDDNEIGISNVKQNWGNSIVIEHTDGLFSSLSHLKSGSINVKIGDAVKKGQMIAKCGNSGRSPIPHLHFQFQLTDKLGDKTYKFPIAHYMSKKNGEYILKTFDYPDENSYVRNIETHDTLKKAFDFKLGDEFTINCKLNDLLFKENWIVKVDMMNNVYLQSDRDAVAYLYLKEKVFYISNFVGNKKSALYYFYLTAIRVPLGFIDDLVWEDEYPVGLTTNPVIRYISEFLLIAGKQLKSTSKLKFNLTGSNMKNFLIKSELRNRGLGLFAFYKETGAGELLINKEGLIKSFSFTKRITKFSAEIVDEPEE